MKCQILFSGKNKKNIINLLSAENSQRVVKVKILLLFSCQVRCWEVQQQSGQTVPKAQQTHTGPVLSVDWSDVSNSLRMKAICNMGNML